MGLVTGIAFIASFVLFTPTHRFPDSLPVEEEFKNIDQLPVVQLFVEKYDNSLKGFGRSNDAIQFHYWVAEYIDKDGDGVRETTRQLELTVLYDESGGNLVYNNFSTSRVKQVEIRCTETPYGGKTGDIKDFIQNARCLS